MGDKLQIYLTCWPVHLKTYGVKQCFGFFYWNVILEDGQPLNGQLGHICPRPNGPMKKSLDIVHIDAFDPLP